MSVRIGAAQQSAIYRLCGRACSAFLILSALISLHSATARAQSGTVKIADIGDFGLSGQPELDVSNLVKSWNPDYIITNGDNNYPAGASSTIDANIGQYYHSYMFPYSGKYGAGAASNRFFPCIGNHDWGDKYPNPSGLNPYLQYFTLPNNERYYDFTVGPVQFFAIDSDPNEPDGTSSSSKQALWLKGKLAASTARWKIVYFHHPPFTSSQYPEDTTVYMQWPFQAWGASAVIAGHVHVYERIMKGGFPYIVNGAGGNPSLFGWGSIASGSVVRYNSDFGALRITASSTSILFEFITRFGVLVDSYSIGSGVPTNLTAVGGNGQVGLSWTSAAGATSYNVSRATTAGGPYTKIASSVLGTTFTDTGVTNGTTYYYVVTANVSGGESGNSNEARAVPQLSALRVNAGGGAYSGASGTFQADAFSSGGFPWTYSSRPIANTPDPALYLDVTASDTSFTYSLPAAAGNYLLKLHFAECSNNGPGLRLMNIDVNGARALTNFDIFATAGAMNTAVIQSIPVSSVNGKVAVTVTSALTTSGAVLAALELASAGGGGSPPPPPSAPTGLTGSPAPQAAALTWMPSSGASFYTVKRSGTPGGPYSNVVSNLMATSYTNSGLSAGTPYYFVVSASNTGGESSNSAEVTVTPQAQGLSAPTNLAATGGNSQVALTWTASAGAAAYNVLRSAASGGPYTAIAVNVAPTSYTDTGVTNGTTYYYVVQAVSAPAQSPNSNEARATPGAAPVLRINAGGSAYSGPGGTFQPDIDVTGGFEFNYSSRNIAGTADPALYLDVRASDTDFSYSLPVPNGSYTLKLYFAECTHGTVGERLMNIDINGVRAITNFDIFATAGALNTAVIKSFPATATNGKIDLHVATALTTTGAVLAAIDVIPN